MSNNQPLAQGTVVVLCGGKSEEADVSLVSGRAVAAALEALGFRCERIELEEDALPQGLDPRSVVVFPVMHGGYGEGGALQRDLEAAGLAYVGSDAAASALCMDKVATKRRIAGSGFAIAPSIAFSTAKLRPAQMLWRALTEAEGNEASAGGSTAASGGADPAAARAGVSGAVLKPRSGGSSVGLFLLDTPEELDQVLPALAPGEWLLEGRISGREMTLGVLDGKAQAIVEIVPEGGVYDFTRKYRAGSTQYLFPAPLEDALRQKIEQMGEHAFATCGCRDFARIDFILDNCGRAFFLEINTLPGMTPTSLLPKSVKARGVEFEALVERMLLPALARGGFLREAFLKD